MNWLGDIVGIILTLIGMFWILQGTGIVPVGVMARQDQWAVIGLVVGVVGIGLLAYINRRPGSRHWATG